MTHSIPKEITSSLNAKWDKFRMAFKNAGFTLPDDLLFRENMKRMFAFSDFAAKSCTLNPETVNDLIQKGDVYRQYHTGEYDERVKKCVSTVKDATETGGVLRKLRNREMIRIAWRDLTGAADLFETMSDLSALADACIDNVFSYLYQNHCQKFGVPKSRNGSQLSMVVIGMGKLGGFELNFSSDIDLIFAFPEAGETSGQSQKITNEEFFTGLARHFLKIFSDTGPDGILFRVDMRLRPFGENGPLVMSFNAMEEYYQNQGREWERYALIKARVVAGDKKAGEQLLIKLKPFIYRRYLDYGVYEALRDLKQKIALEVDRKGSTNNIKLGAGGIREIEFFGQIFQLIRGGVEPIFQERSILKVLAHLAQEAYIPQPVCDELTQAYIFLRNTEHRLQEFSDQQTHDLPASDMGKLLLAASMGFNGWNTFEEKLKNHMHRVHHHFNQLLLSENENDSGNPVDRELDAVWQGVVTTGKAEEILKSAGFTGTEDILSLLNALQNDKDTVVLSGEARNRLDRLIPLLLKKTGPSENPDITFKRLIDLVKAIERRSCYISLLLENPDALTHLVKLSNASPWITSFLSKYPVLLDELLDTRTLYNPLQKDALKKELDQRIKRAAEDDLEHQIQEIIIFKHINILRVAAADVTGVFPLMKVSDYLSYIAETVLEKVLDLSWDYLTGKHGYPSCALNGNSCDRGFVVVAYGKLGGLELGYGSDLDLVFLHAGSSEQTRGGSHSIDTPQFFARLGQRVLHLLTTHTSAGRLYEIDMRLRPSGTSGILVSNIEAFKAYQINEAWTWEHQALLRTRAVCGNEIVKACFEHIRKEVLCLPRETKTLGQKIKEMREKMRKEHDKTTPGYFDVKQGAGGVVDIEFIVQYLVLLNANRHPELVYWSDNIRQLEALANTSILDKETAQFLTESYKTLRSDIHKLSLQEKPAIVPEDKFIGIRGKVTSLWNTVFHAGI